MARTVNHAHRTIRRDAFVDAAQHLIASKGYEQMSVQDVLDALDASRGAFYHYFDSKVALLEAVIDRMVVEATARVERILADPDVSALAKLSRLLTDIADYKNERRDLLRGFLQVWLSDDNVLVRDKLRRLTGTRLTPLLAPIVRQGCAEGTFSVSSADETARVLVSLLQGLNELASELFLIRQAGAITLEQVEHTVSAYLEAFERILGVPAGSLPRQQHTLREWFG
ncbi:MAG TPA: TetR/AcrR family transcriptional regulator [Chloroflexota bacterium]